MNVTATWTWFEKQ